MEQILSFITNVAILYGLFILLRFLVGIYTKSKAVTRAAQEEREYLDKIIHVINSEKHQETEYWFDRESGDFLAQGKTFNEIVLALKERFPDHIFIINKEELIAGPDFEIHKIEDGPLRITR